MRAMYLLCLASAILTGCGQGGDARPARAPAGQESGTASEEGTEARATETISVGGDLSAALQALREHGLRSEECNMAFEVADPTLELRMYRVFPKYETPDGLVLAATGKRGSQNFRIDEIYWWIDFEHDAARAKGERKYEERHMQTIKLADLATDNGPRTTDK